MNEPHDDASPSPISAALPDYDVLVELGRGTMGIVYLGRHRRLERQVAIKELTTGLTQGDEVRARFLREARTLASLQHPHIVPVFDYVERSGHCLLIMEALPGGNAWERFRGTGLRPPEACALTLATCAAVAHAHANGVLHRDIKPENLLFGADGTPKVTDFGIAKVIQGSATVATMAGSVLGTPAYMAPEQAEGGEVGPPADVYAVATMLYEFLAGRLPYTADTAMALLVQRITDDPPHLRDVAPDVPLGLADAVMRALARPAADRPQRAEDFGVEVARAATVAFGPDWLDGVGFPVSGSRPILAASRTPTLVPAEVAAHQQQASVAPTPATPEPPAATPEPPAAAPAEPDVRLRDGAVALAQLAVEAAAAYDRPDLRDRLARLRTDVAGGSAHVVVCGEFKQGKSSLVNALLNLQVCAVDDDVATAVPTFLRHGDQPGAVVVTVPADQPDAEPHRTEVALDDVRSYVLERQDAPTDGRVVAVEVQVPRKLLAGGLTVVDTPGVGGLGSRHATATLGAASIADALVFVSDASQEYTAAEMAFLREASAMCGTVACVLTKTDFYPAWRTIRDLDEAHLAHAGVDAPLLSVSSPLRAAAVRANDAALNDESGFPALLRFLVDRVRSGAEAAAAARVAADVSGVASQLATQLEAERVALTDPARAQQIVDDLTATKARTERLRGQAAKWNQTLADGVADLTSDVDHDFRARVRRLLADTDAAIDQSDPADTWDEFAPWLYARMSHEVVANYALLRDRAGELSQRVGEHFQEASGDVLRELDVFNPLPLVTDSGAGATIDVEAMSVGKQGLTLLRNSYSGILMFTLMGSIVGVALGPIAIGIGLVLGGKALRDEKQRQLTLRRTQAKNAVRKYADEISFAVQKDARDTMRRIQRQLRDHYAARAEELHRSTTDALAKASEAATRTKADREKRLRDVVAELDRVRILAERADRLAAAATSVGGRETG